MGLHYVECAPLMYAIIVLAFILHVMRGCLSFCFLRFAFFFEHCFPTAPEMRAPVLNLIQFRSRVAIEGIICKQVVVLPMAVVRHSASVMDPWRTVLEVLVHVFVEHISVRNRLHWGCTIAWQTWTLVIWNKACCALCSEIRPLKSGDFAMCCDVCYVVCWCVVRNDDVYDRVCCAAMRCALRCL